MKIIYFILSILSLGFIACSPKYYSPNHQNVPLLDQKGNANVRFATTFKRTDFQAAYALSDNIGLQFNSAFYDSGLSEIEANSNGNIIELGLGYMARFKENYIFEIYGLGGLGHVQNDFPQSVENFPETTGIIDADIRRLGVQGNIGAKSKLFDFAFSLKLSHLNYSNIDGSLIHLEEDQSVYLMNNNSNVLFEPAITFRGGPEIIKLEFQFGTSRNLSNLKFRQTRTYLSMGLSININSYFSSPIMDIDN